MEYTKPTWVTKGGNGIKFKFTTAKLTLQESLLASNERTILCRRLSMPEP